MRDPIERLQETLRGNVGPEHIDVLLNPHDEGHWWVAYSATEGFSPLVFLIKAETPDEVEDLFLADERVAGTDRESLVVERSPWDYGSTR